MPIGRFLGVGELRGAEAEIGLDRNLSTDAGAADQRPDVHVERSTAPLRHPTDRPGARHGAALAKDSGVNVDQDRGAHDSALAVPGTRLHDASARRLRKQGDR
jgi:hypothetical protein